MTVKALAIGSSTGGPEALAHLLGALDAELRQPIFITQHLTEVFMPMMAESLSRKSGRICREAVDGEKVQESHVYIAPGGHHMLVTENRRIALSAGAPENFCRPAVDPMLRSLARVYGRGAIGGHPDGHGQRRSCGLPGGGCCRRARDRAG